LGEHCRQRGVEGTVVHRTVDEDLNHISPPTAPFEWFESGFGCIPPCHRKHQ
jgi:hypothetical protein